MKTRTGEDWVDNKPVRRAVEKAIADGLTLNEICRRLGWLRAGGGETSRLQRRLGMKPYTSGNGHTGLSRTLRYEIAVEIVRAIDRDPVDLGL